MQTNSGNPGQAMQGNQAPLDISQLPTQPQVLPGQLGMEPETPVEDQQEGGVEETLRAFLESANIAAGMDEQKLKNIGRDAFNGKSRLTSGLSLLLRLRKTSPTLGPKPLT